MYLVENIAEKVGIKIVSVLKLDEDNKEVIIYGAINLFQTLLSIFWISMFGIIFNVLLESLLIIFVISILRKYSGGVHSESPVRCIVISTSICIGLALILKNKFYYLDKFLILIFILLSFIYSYYGIFKYAPVDSKFKPIINIDTRNKLKNISILVLNILISVQIILYYIFIKYDFHILYNIINCINFGIVWQTFTLTPIGIRVLIKLDIKLKYFLFNLNKLRGKKYEK